MQLRTFLDLTKRSVPSFADEVEVTPTTVWRWLAGTRHPNPDQMRSVFMATFGAVAPNDWVLVWPVEADAAGSRHWSADLEVML